MECPDCRAGVTGHAATCPHCGAVLAVAHTAAEATVGIVEGTVERGPVSIELPLPMPGEADTACGDGRGAARADTRLVVRNSSLPAVLWQQPAVRAVAQAGAGAIALTLGMRLLRAWLTRPAAARSVTSTALPVVADLLRATDTSDGEASRRERGEVVETVIYMRRVIRRW